MLYRFYRTSNLGLDSRAKWLCVRLCGVVKKQLYCNPYLSLTVIAPLSLILTQVCENMWSVNPGYNENDWDQKSHHRETHGKELDMSSSVITHTEV